jgi:hypothetical protein
MDEVRDAIYYPKPFKYFDVISKDANNDALITKFYADAAGTKEVFKWTQRWWADGKIRSWKCEVKGEDYQ